MGRYLVGIDLGTTNIAVAYVDTASRAAGGPKLHTFNVPQVVAAGQVQELPLLPSFLYLPGPHDLAPGSIDLPWKKGPPDTVGAFARNHGAKVPGRQVSSASRGSPTPASIAARRFCPGLGRPTSRDSRRWMSARSISATSSRPGTTLPAARPRTGSKTRRWSSRCPRRSMTWHAT